MKTKTTRLFMLACLLITSSGFALDKTNKSFDIVALGTQGGLYSSNLSSFYIGAYQQNVGVSCDAGTLLEGIDQAIALGNFTLPDKPSKSLREHVFQDYIKGYLISHAHLDHVAGLIIASPDDTAKTIYGLESTLNTISDHYFNWQAWPNFGTHYENSSKDIDGSNDQAPALNKYQYQKLNTGKRQQLRNTPMWVTAMPLSHSGIDSTAFIVEYKEDIVVCLGDTGPDSVEKSDKLKELWQHIAPKAKQGKLKAIIIESSFSDERPDDSLFGHLTPKYIKQTLADLALELGSTKELRALPVIVSNIKPSLDSKVDVKKKIEQQLNKGNITGFRFIIPEQGQKWQF